MSFIDIHCHILPGMGDICQITAMCVTAGFGREIEDAAFAMIERGLADIIASDAHNRQTSRPPILSKAYEEVKKHFGRETAERLFFGNPGRIMKNVRCQR